MRQWRTRERLIRRELAKRDNPIAGERFIPVLDRCVDLLVGEYGVDTFARDQLLAPPSPHADRRQYVQSLLELAAGRWQVVPPPIDVSLVPTQGRTWNAGTFAPTTAHWLVTLGATGGVNQPELLGWEIRVDPAYLADDLALSVIIAHEFAHGVLTRDGVALSDPGENESLTDVAAALCGFGELMLKLQRRVIRGYRGKALTWTIGGPGYLWPPALEHILWRHKRLLSNPTTT